MRKEQLLNIYEDNGLYGAKDQNGQIVITDDSAVSVPSVAV